MRSRFIAARTAGRPAALQRADGVPYGPPGVRSGVPIEITVDKDDPNTVFVNNYGGGVFKSIDGAQTWQCWARIHGRGHPQSGGQPAKSRAAFGQRSQRSVPKRRRRNDWRDFVRRAHRRGGVAERAYDPTNGATLYVSDEHQVSFLKAPTVEIPGSRL